MKHPQHDLLIAAANDDNARFTSSEFDSHSNNTYSLMYVIANPYHNWKLVDKFAELRKAYAEGKTIQALSIMSGNWNDIGHPSWEVDTEYRIKPEPVYEWQWLYKDRGIKKFYITEAFYKDEPIYDNRFESLYRIEESKREVKS